MARIYTRTGDKGETSLVSGTRVSKDDERINLYGEIDELNSFLGLLVVKTTEDKDRELLKSYQNNLFNLGSRLACESDLWETYKLPGINKEIIERTENRIDELDGKLTKLSNFILPGGSEASAMGHVCRTITRRCERFMVHFEKLDRLPESSLEFINRLSDYLFVLARYENQLVSEADVIWSKE